MTQGKSDEKERDPRMVQNSWERTPQLDPMLNKTLDGRYLITKMLGRGGMGAVYQARHLSLDKFVAVKVMHDELMSDQKIVQRFRREVSAMSTLAHPNLISIQDVGLTDTGTPYFVMEYLDCLTLGDLIKKEVIISPERAIPLFLQMADALAHAHEKGIVHRDLKPANILILESENRDFVKVVDLGIAKWTLPDDSGELQRLTATGEAFGSPLYMSPEQVLGKEQDERTDIYALAVLMFEMLTSVPPMLRKSAISVMNAHVSEPAPTFTKMMPELPMTPELQRLESIIMTCMEKDPNKRIQTMRELIHAIGADIPMDSGKYAMVRTGSQSGVQPEMGSGVRRGVNRIVEPPSEYLQMTGQKGQTGSGDSQRHSTMPPPLIPPPETKSGKLDDKTMILAAIAGLVVIVVISVSVFVLSLNNNQQANSGMTAAYRVFEVDYPEYKGDKTNLRVLSVYNGFGDSNPNDGGVIQGKIDVAVHQEGRPIVLVLNSYMPTTWNVSLASSNVKISKVITVGYHPQKVFGLPKSTKQVDVYYQYFKPDGSESDKPTHKNAIEPFHFLYTEGDDVPGEKGFQIMKSILEKYTSSHLRSFQGTRSTKSFTVR